MDWGGLVCLDGVLSREWLEAARDSVKSHLATHGERDFFVIRACDEENTPAHRLVNDGKIEAIFKAVTLARCPQGFVNGEGIYSVLSVLAGPTHESSPLCLHYDASVITMVVPLFIPEAGPGVSGESVIFPNRRPFRCFVMSNIVEKVFTQSGYYRKRIMRNFHQDPERHIVQLKPGSVYLFWGYRTYHGNLPCAPDALRAVLLLHYGNPHDRRNPVLTAAKFFSVGMPQVQRDRRNWRTTP